jgi:uncharacterized Zn finger protein
MLLSNIEKYIDHTILKRGFQYYESGRVEDLDEIVPGQYEATVSGTEEYFVEVRIEENKIVDSYCNCPYDYSHICKHQTAVFFAIKNENDRVHKKQELPALLKQLRKDELIELLLDLANEKTNVKQQLLFLLSKSTDELESSEILIKEYINKAKIDGFIHYDQTDFAVAGAEQVLHKAQKKLTANEIETAVKLSILVLSHIVEMTQFCDDSSGTVGQIINEAIFTIKDAVEEGLDILTFDERNQLLSIILKEALHSRYIEINDEWSHDLIRACIPFSDIPEQRVAIERTLTNMLDASQDSWNFSSIKSIQLDIIELNDEAEDVERFIFNNLAWSDFRDKAINSCIQKSQYKKALEICLEGEKKDHDKRGLLSQWKNYRYVVYEKMNDLKKQKDIAYELLLQGEYKYFNILKKLTPKKEWERDFYQILPKLKESYIYTDILIEENQMELLLDYCSIHSYKFFELYPYLIKDYPNEVSRLFTVFIKNEVKYVSNRSGYRKVCGLLKVYKKACGIEKVNYLTKELKETYKKRPAFIDELNKVK